ncbi:hypothetical protein LXA43DRAFT_449442 [Ganoderma leucocontextum]|nr:hypothetical protein LXA43DRAFT_449442 [Ganoderma leucocontextum]
MGMGVRKRPVCRRRWAPRLSASSGGSPTCPQWHSQPAPPASSSAPSSARLPSLLVLSPDSLSRPRHPIPFYLSSPIPRSPTPASLSSPRLCSPAHNNCPVLFPISTRPPPLANSTDHTLLRPSRHEMLASNDPDIPAPPHLLPANSSFDSDFPSPTHPSHLSLSTKKKHSCQICNRTFTTSGHLARHTRIHTGERNHKCPFPGCETRCSRQDNLQQHYRIHLSPGSRRSSGSATRAAMNRASASDRSRSTRKRSKNDSPHSASPPPPPPIPSPPLEPPALTQAYPTLPSGLPEPPDTPPPLAQAYPTLPPPIAPAFPQQSLSARPSSRSSRSTPEATYYSPVSYAHPSLAPVPTPSHPQYHEEVAYPPSSQGSRASSFGRPGDDPRWPYHSQGEQSYPASESDRYSPVSPVTNSNGHFQEPASPVESLHGHHRAHSQVQGHVQMSPQDSVSYFNHYHQPAARQPQPNTAGPTSASPVSLSQSQPSSSSHRHSIAHISNPIRQHSPTSTNSASPVVSTPPTPGYGYVSQTMGTYAESPPGSLSPVTPVPPQQQQHAVPVYNSYESSSLASAGYSHPPPAQTQHVPQQQQQQQQQMYDRTLPALTATHAREPQAPSSMHPQTHFNYAQQQAAYQPNSNSMGVSDRYGSERPVLAPLVGSRVMRGDPGGSNPSGVVRYASPQPQQPLASRVAGSAHHAFSYTPHSQVQPNQMQVSPPQSAHPHSAHSQSEAPYTPTGGYGQAASPQSNAHAQSEGEYYYQVQAHAHAQREPSPDEVAGGQEQYLELHQPQPRPPHASHQYIQTGAVMHGHGHGHGHAAHPVWRGVEDYRGRLVQ